MTLGEILKQATYTVESIPDPGQWDKPTYVAAINWACLQAALLARLTFTVLPPLTIPAGQNVGLLFPTPLLVLGVRTVTNKHLPKSSPAIESQLDPTWRSRVGTPTAWFLENGNRIRLNAILSADSQIVVEILETPTVLVNDSDQVDTRIPDPIQDSLRFFAAAYLYSQAGDQDDLRKAAAFTQQGQALVMEKMP